MYPHPKHALPPGHLIAGYSIIRVIGQGGFGIVYEALNRITLDRAAIKEFYPTAIASRRDVSIVLNNERESDIFANVLKRFEQEAKLQHEFRHRNILRVKNYVPGPNTGYMITDYIRGETLRKYLQKSNGHFPTEEMLHYIMEQILGAVGYVHHQGTLHRDMSPDNIMVDEFGRAVLLDFGAAKLDLRASSTFSSIVPLREDYAPLEQADRSPDRPEGFYTDIFALAGTMYCGLAGAPPKRAISRQLAASDPYVPIAQASKIPCSPQICAAIDCALRLSIHERPQTIEDFATMLGWQPRYEGDKAEDDGPVRPPENDISVIRPPEHDISVIQPISFGESWAAATQAARLHREEQARATPIEAEVAVDSAAAPLDQSDSEISRAPVPAKHRATGRRYGIGGGAAVLVIAAVAAIAYIPREAVPPPPNPASSQPVKPSPVQPAIQPVTARPAEQPIAPPPARPAPVNPPSPPAATLPIRPAPPALQPPTFRAYANSDMEGGDLRPHFLIADQGECKRACQADKNCQAYTYGKWDKACYLKNNVTYLRTEPNSITEILSNLPEPPVMNSPLRIETFKNSVLKGHAYRTMDNTSEDVCKSSCDKENKCWGYQFHNGNCALYDEIEDRDRHGQSSDRSGIKRQPAP